MPLNFTNLPDELIIPANRAINTLNLANCADYDVTVASGSNLSVSFDNNTINITYSKKVEFFRALSHIAEQLKNSKPQNISETAQFDTCGIMPDVSFSSPATVQYICSLLDYMAVMGMNVVWFYIEDMYEIEGRDFFGYMSGKYTPEELKAIDDYAYEYGIEVIPAIQTLGHLGKYFKWYEPGDLKENASTLNIKNPKIYDFIEEMIVSSSKCFRTNRIHVGLDESWGIGRSEANLKKYGVLSQQELFIEHVNKVYDIVKKHNLRPIMWNDMIFCLYSKSGVAQYDEDIEIPREVMDKFPKDMQLTYWHYGQEKQNCDDYMLAKYKKFGNDVIYAGGLWMWSEPLPDNEFSYVNHEEGLIASKKHGVREVVDTLWCYGGCGADMNYSLLSLQQFAEHMYHEAPTREHLKARFEATTGASFEAFMNMTNFGNVYGGKTYPNENYRHYGRKYMWQHPMYGIYDAILYDNPVSSWYADNAEFYEQFTNTDDKWYLSYLKCKHIYEFMAQKCYISENIKPKYEAGDKDFLVKCEKELFPALLTKTKELHEDFRTMWFNCRKPLCWELLDGKMAEQEGFIISSIKRLEAYNNGLIDKLEELEEPRHAFRANAWGL